MHNPVGPWAEANSLYIEQSQLAQRLNESSNSANEELIVFDVGLGAAANALAALHCAKNCAAQNTPGRDLRLISFERDLELLQFALDHSHEFEHFRGYEDAIAQILRTGSWEGQLHQRKCKWELRHGDFLEKISVESLVADLVFFDPYSSSKNPEMWSAETFKKIFDRCNHANPAGSLLLTYSRATPVRMAMLHAGFFVGIGLASGPKEETTQASTNLELLARPLTSDWLKRRPTEDSVINTHRQFTHPQK